MLSDFVPARRTDFPRRHQPLANAHVVLGRIVDHLMAEVDDVVLLRLVLAADLHRFIVLPAANVTT